ncbi:MAG: SUMF1/EgtB/PvdO family nonheme iron enzyme, partial [Chloroflexi bacterium]|nr:SUMF1/EgtB/PvdO family nonheme iron enzyme [Chloroflexota bacterium]
GLIGTPKYMSPEQCLGKKDLTPASDQYALGIILYEMVTGAAPFDAETPLAVIQQHVSAPLAPPHIYRPDLPEAVESVILKVLSREPEARYPTCNDLANAFSKAVASTATSQLSDDAPTLIFDEKATVISEEWERAHPDRISDKVTEEVTARRQPRITRDTHETTQTTDWRKWVLGAAGIGAILLVLFGAFTFLNDDEDADKTASTPGNTVVANNAELDEANGDTPPQSPTEAEATAESTATVAEPTATTPAPTEIALVADQFTLMEPVTSNDEWEPIIHEFEYVGLTVPMVLVPKGCYQMGNDPYSSYYDWDGASEWGVMGIPDGGEVCFDVPFWIDVYEVSNEQFNALNGQASLEGEQTDDNYPRDKVNWDEALAFCTGNREARLPTEAEWEYAARGPDNLYHAWGDDLLEITTIPPLNYCEGQCYDQFFYEWADRDFDDGYGGTAPIDTYANGVSWVGAYALNGNVWEWVSTLYDLVEFPYPYNANDGREDLDVRFTSRGLRGGSWEGNPDKIRSTTRFGLSKFTSRNTIGFRCARTYTGMPPE